MYSMLIKQLNLLESYVSRVRVDHSPSKKNHTRNPKRLDLKNLKKKKNKPFTHWAYKRTLS